MTLVRALPRESATVQAMRGDLARWGETEYLLAAIVDRLSVLVWQPTKDGHAGKNQPDRWPRPGAAPAAPSRTDDLLARLRDQRARLHRRQRRTGH